jgi:sugar O-acyltransferase (sialic acid O-acetyltransferase NeuD family)
MKQLIIIGAGGMGRTFYSNALESRGFGEEFVVKGFIDDNLQALDGFAGYPPILGTIRDYRPQPDDVFVSSIGGTARRTCMEGIIARGGVFIELIHKTARIYQNARLGKGNFIGACTVIGNDAVIGDYNMIQAYTVIGHDARIGSWNRIDTHVTCVGGIVLEDDVDIHTSAVINHGVTVGTGARVGALSFVIRKVKPHTTVYGNPARVIEV